MNLKLIIFHLTNVVLNFCVILCWQITQHPNPETRFPLIIILVIFVNMITSFIFFNPAKYKFLKYRLDNVFTGLQSVIVFTLIYFLILIFFGAHIIRNLMKTFELSVFLTIITVWPFILDNENIFKMLLSENFMQFRNFNENYSKMNMFLTWSGAWFGAFLIPLDWHEPYQIWPVSCGIGAIFGTILSNFIFLVYNVVIFNKRWLNRSHLKQA